VFHSYLFYFDGFVLFLSCHLCDRDFRLKDPSADCFMS